MLKSIKNIFLPHKPDEEALKQSAYDFSFTNAYDEPIDLAEFKGKVIMVVNTASQCGFTKQYDDLEELWQKYKMKGLQIIAVPSNDFKNQEPGTNKEIKQFCKKNFGVSFPITAKEVIKGKYAHPFYSWAEKILGGAATPKWNFHKYIISKEGKLIDFFVPFTRPTSKKIIKVIEENL